MVLNFEASPLKNPDEDLVTSSVCLFPPSERNERRVMSRNVLHGKAVNGALFSKFSVNSMSVEGLGST